jgi:phenylpyruvate tautomerase PptA (4-oxalocrotonate tautomerase family)
MSYRRSLSWSAATRDMRNDRTFVAPAATLAERVAREEARKDGIRLYREAKAALVVAVAQPLATAAGYDRSAIMVLANAIVREQMAAVAGRSYRDLIGAALKKAWASARDARRAAAH